MNLFCVGVLLNIAARNPEPPRLRVWQARRRSRANRRRVRRVVIADGDGAGA